MSKVYNEIFLDNLLERTLSLESNARELSTVYKLVKRSNKVDQDLAIGLESQYPGIIRSRVAIGSFTDKPSERNVSITLEGLSVALEGFGEAIGAAIRKIWDSIINFFKKIYNWFKGLFNKGETGERDKARAARSEQEAEYKEWQKEHEKKNEELDKKLAEYEEKQKKYLEEAQKAYSDFKKEYDTIVGDDLEASQRRLTLVRKTIAVFNEAGLSFPPDTNIQQLLADAYHKLQSAEGIAKEAQLKKEQAANEVSELLSVFSDKKLSYSDDFFLRNFTFGQGRALLYLFLKKANPEKIQAFTKELYAQAKTHASFLQTFRDTFLKDYSDLNKLENVISTFCYGYTNNTGPGSEAMDKELLDRMINGTGLNAKTLVTLLLEAGWPEIEINKPDTSNGVGFDFIDNLNILSGVLDGRHDEIEKTMKAHRNEKTLINISELTSFCFDYTDGICKAFKEMANDDTMDGLLNRLQKMERESESRVEEIREERKKKLSAEEFTLMQRSLSIETAFARIISKGISVLNKIIAVQVKLNEFIDREAALADVSHKHVSKINQHLINLTSEAEKLVERKVLEEAELVKFNTDVENLKNRLASLKTVVNLG